MPLVRTLSVNGHGLSPSVLIEPGEFRCIESYECGQRAVLAVACHPSDEYGELFLIEGSRVGEVAEVDSAYIADLLDDDRRISTIEGIEPYEHQIINSNNVLGTLAVQHFTI